jgi:hypothetical protein
VTSANGFLFHPDECYLLPPRIYRSKSTRASSDRKEKLKNSLNSRKMIPMMVPDYVASEVCFLLQLVGLLKECREYMKVLENTVHPLYNESTIRRIESKQHIKNVLIQRVAGISKIYL